MTLATSTIVVRAGLVINPKFSVQDGRERRRVSARITAVAFAESATAAEFGDSASVFSASAATTARRASSAAAISSASANGSISFSF